MLFFYSAQNKDDQPERGTIDAVSAQAAVQALREMDLIAEELHEATLQEKKAISEGTIDIPDMLHTPNLVLEGEIDIPDTKPEPQEEKIPKEPKKQKAKPAKKRKKKKNYYPFQDTLRLYAGWLLAWYCIVYMLGGYQYTRDLSFRIPYIEALLPPFSPIVLTFTLAAFLFLLCTSLHKTFGSGRVKGIVISVLGIAVFTLYRLNV